MNERTNDKSSRDEVFLFVFQRSFHFSFFSSVVDSYATSLSFLIGGRVNPIVSFRSFRFLFLTGIYILLLFFHHHARGLSLQ